MEVNDFILKYGKRSNELQGKTAKPLEQYSFKMVKITIPQLLQESKFKEIAEKLLKIKNVEDNQNLINFVLWVGDEIEAINKRESELLSTPPDAEMIQAGIHKLNTFGIIGTLESLSSNILDWDKLLKLTYYDVFIKLLLNKTTNDIQRNYQKIMMEKSKQRK